MANEFDYLSIIADKDVVDPTYDVSGLRTTTPTDVRLLADVPEYSGLRYDPTQRSYLEDLYNLYSGGLPTIPVAPAPVTPTTVVDTPVDTGGGGLDVVDQLETDAGINTPINVDTPLTQMVTTPTGDTMTVKEAFTQDDAYSLDEPITTEVDTTPDYSGAGTASPIAEARGTPISEMGTRPPDFVAGAQTFTDPVPGSEGNIRLMSRADVTPEIQPVAGPFDYLQDEPVTLTGPQPGEGDVRGFGEKTTEQEASQALMDPTMMIPQVPPYTDRIMDENLMDIQQQQYEDQLNTPEVQEDLAKVKEGVSDATGFISRWGVPLWNAAKGKWGAALAGFAGLPGAVLGLTAGLGGGVPNKANIGGLNQEQADLVDNYSVGNTGKDELGKNIISMAEMLNPGQYLENRIKRGQDVTDEDLEKLGYIDPVSPDVAAGKEFETGDAALAEQIAAEEREQAAAEAAAIEQARAQREMQEQIAAAEAMEAARQADIDRQNREAAAAAAATQRARDAASRPSGEGAGAGGGSQQATSGGGFSSGWGGGWGWSKGGIVSLKNGKR